MPSLRAPRPWSVLLGLLLAGCSGPPPAPSVTPPPPPSATASAPAEAATTPPAPEPLPAKEAPPWVVVGEVRSPARLFAVEGALFVVPDEIGPLPPRKGGDERSGYPISLVRDSKLETPPYLELEGWFQRVVAIEGRWPDSVEMLAGSDTGRIGYVEHFTMSARGWITQPNPCAREHCRDPGSWYLGMHRVGPSLIALTAPLMIDQPTFRTIRGPLFAPRMTPAPKECAHLDESFVTKILVRPQLFGGTADGTLISVGNACTGGLVAEVWKPGAAASTITRLEAESREGNELAPAGGRILTGIAQDAWVLDGKVRHYDGAWQEIPLPKGPSTLPGDPSFTAGALAPDGTLWVVNDKGVWKRKGESWTEVPVPDNFVPTDVAATGDGEVWLSGSNVLLRLTHPGEAAGPAVAAIKPAAGPHPLKRPVTAGSPRCPQNLVILYGFTRVTPEDYDFPLTRKALKGHTELSSVKFLVTRDYGKKFLAASVPSFDVGKKVVSVIEKGVVGSKPQVICAVPEVVRELKIDLRTGEVQKP